MQKQGQRGSVEAMDFNNTMGQLLDDTYFEGITYFGKGERKKNGKEFHMCSPMCLVKEWQVINWTGSVLYGMVERID